MFSKKGEIWSYSIFSKILDKLDRKEIGRYLLFPFRESFLYTGVISTNFGIERKVEELFYLFT